MKVYGQIIHESGSWAQPQADEYIQFDSLTEAKRTLQACGSDIDAHEGVTLVLVRGTPDPDDPYPCDFSAHYPDYVFRLGPEAVCSANTDLFFPRREKSQTQLENTMTTNTTHPIFTRIEKRYNETKPIRGWSTDVRPWGNRRRQNEIVRKIDDNTYAARLYDTDVVTVHRDGRVVIDITFDSPTTNKFADLVACDLKLEGFMASRAHGRPWIYADGAWHPANLTVTLKPHDTLLHNIHVVDMSDRRYVRLVADREARRPINDAVRKLRSVLAPLCALTDGKFTGDTLAAIYDNTPAALRYDHKPSLELAIAAIHAAHDVDDPEQLLAMALLVCAAGGTGYAMPGAPDIWRSEYPYNCMVDVQLLSDTAKQIFNSRSEYWKETPITEPLYSTHEKVRVYTK